MDIRFPNGRLLALTLSYDDGVQQDEKLISILNAHGIRATFNLNSGLFAPEGTVFPKGQIHRRLTESQVKALYDVSVHEVAVHCLTHRSLPEIPAPRMIHEIMEDRIHLEDLFGVIVRGSAYPFGTFNDTAVEALDLCGIAYCRTVISSHDFRLPSDWLRLEPTCHHDDPMLDELCDRFLASSRPSLFYLWGHAYEFEAHDNWDRIEQFCSRMGGRDEIWYCTNLEAHDYIEAYRHLVLSADGKRVFNPSSLTLWIEENKQIFCLHPGESLVFE